MDDYEDLVGIAGHLLSIKVPQGALEGLQLSQNTWYKLLHLCQQMFEGIFFL